MKTEVRLRQLPIPEIVDLEGEGYTYLSAK
jgi:hypothetical protein